MKEYWVRLNSKSNKNLEREAKDFLKKAHDLGYILKHQERKISYEVACDILIKNECNVVFDLQRNDFYFQAIIGPSKIELESALSQGYKFENLELDERPKWILKEFLKLTDTWVLGKIRIDFDFTFFFESLMIPSLEEMDAGGYDKEYAKQLVTNSRGIHGCVLINTAKYDLESLKIMLNLSKYNYILISDFEEQGSSEFKGDNNEWNIIERAILSKKPVELYLLIEKWIVKLTFNGLLLSLTPVDTIKMKIVEGNTDVDIAFYLTIYLNIIDGLGLEDMLVTFH